MTVGALSGNWLSSSQFSQLNGASQSPSASLCEAGQSSATQGGGLFNAVVQSLQQIGATGQMNSSSSGSSGDSPDSTSAQDPAQALASFMQSLMGALHVQNSSAGGTAGKTGGGDASQIGASTSGVSRGSGHHHHHMKADLDSLMQQVSGDSSNVSTGAADATAATDASGSATADLQQSFRNLMDSLGQSGSPANLGQFLKAFSVNVQDMGPAGNVVSTVA